uniref:Uncharacterized protein n=1 Tax=Arundo donax TaxID=35708 RepID=A0A0A9ALD6_ARUDO
MNPGHKLLPSNGNFQQQTPHFWLI